MGVKLGGKAFEKRVYPKLSENDLAGLFAAQKAVGYTH